MKKSNLFKKILSLALVICMLSSFAIPAMGAEVPGNSEILVYLGEEVPKEPVTVPNFMGMTVAEARQAAKNAGIYIQAQGTDTAVGAIYVTYQSVAGGTSVQRGSTIHVEFTDNTVRD